MAPANTFARPSACLSTPRRATSGSLQAGHASTALTRGMTQKHHHQASQSVARLVKAITLRSDRAMRIRASAADDNQNTEDDADEVPMVRFPTPTFYI